MKQKRVIIIVSIVIILTLIGIVGKIALGKKSNIPVTQEKPLASLSQIAQNFLTWKDDLGFSFDYPEEAVVNKHDEDQDNYAHVELTHKDHPGSLIVWAKDPPKSKTGKLVTSAEEWIAIQTELKDALVIDTNWGGQKAKKVKVNGLKPKLLVVAYYDGLIYYIEVDLVDSDYWSAVSDKVISTFSFSPKKETAGEGGADNGDSGSVDEEEVVE